VLLLWVTIGQICIYAIWRGRGTWPVVLTLAVATGLAGLTKGPVVVGIHAMTVLALVAIGRGTPRGSRPFLSHGSSPLGLAAKCVTGLLAVAVIVGPWVYLIEQRQPGFIGTAIWHDVITRSGSGLEKHGGPPGYHLATIWAFFLPWSLLLPMGVVLGWKHRHLPLVRFALAAVVGPWLMFEAIRTKLPHYMLPTYPWLALLVADAIVRCLRGQYPELKGKPFQIALGGWAAAVALAGAALPFVTARRFGEYGVALAVTAAAAAYGAALLLLLRARRTASVVAVLGIGVALLWLIGWTVFFPQAQFLRLSVRVADVLKRQGATGPGDAVMLDYKEPSLAFYQGGTIRMNPKMELSHDLLDRGPPWLVITDEVWRRTPQDVRQRVQVVAAYKGLSYADEGRTLWVMIVRNVRR
jgi:4-amino-4-deoxy-L-arabinose transferase-like glycosyltransferase